MNILIHSWRGLLGLMSGFLVVCLGIYAFVTSLPRYKPATIVASSAEYIVFNVDSHEALSSTHVALEKPTLCMVTGADIVVDAPKDPHRLSVVVRCAK